MKLNIRNKQLIQREKHRQNNRVHEEVVLNLKIIRYNVTLKGV